MADVLTPMMQQYRRLRGSIPADTLLLFRLGDFYELFFEDATEAAHLLNVALTKRNGVPMCGVPYHAAPNYITKLIKAGRRVAICDQTSEPQPGKIVSRDITQIISAGTVSDLDLLQAKRANYLGAVFGDGTVFGFAYADLSTGEFRVAQLEDRQSLFDELARVAPSELLVSDEQKQQFTEIAGALGYDDYASCLNRRPSPYANISKLNRWTDSAAHECRRRSLPPARSSITSSINFAGISIILRRCVAMRHPITCCSMLPRKPISSWLNPEIVATPVCWRCSIAQSRQWADANCARGSYNRCAI